MNILVLCHYGLYQDLTLSFVHAQAKAYAASGHQVKVLVPIAWGKRDWQGSRFAQRHFTRDGVQIISLRYLTLSRYGALGFNTRRAIAAVSRQYRRIFAGFTPDVIHAHTLGFDSTIGAWLKKRLGCPLVVTTHGSDTSIPADTGKGARLIKAASGADLIVGVTSTLTTRLERCGVKTPMRVVHNGFRIENLPEKEERDSMRIIQVGTLNLQKRVCRTIEAFARLKQAHPAMSLELIGSGPDEATLRAQCKTLGVSDSVCFRGKVPNAEVFRALASSRFFCLPSFREGFAISYLEAMANGCITIGSEGEGISDFIVHGKNGFLVTPDDVDDIVSVVEWCYANPDEAAAIAEQGRKDALTMTWERNAAQYISLFETLIKKQRS